MDSRVQGGLRLVGGCNLLQEFALEEQRTHTIVTEIITKLIRWEFSPVMLRSKLTKLIIWNFHPVVHCRILFTEFPSKCHQIGERQGVFGNGPESLSN